jgi:CO/xanthine dehydrogenase FAD-binding subunit
MDPARRSTSERGFGFDSSRSRRWWPERLPLLATAVRQIGNVRVRAVATVGGTLCEADYQSDFAVALSALGARVHVRRQDGARVVPIEDFSLVGSEVMT